MNEPMPLLAFEGTPRRVAPAWGIAAIFGLLGLLGVVLQQRFSNTDQSWTRWEKHELTGVVLGQSPEQDFQPASQTPVPAPQSTVPPLWSQTNSSRAGSPRTAREKNQRVGAPVQTEAVGAEEAADPFSAVGASAKAKTSVKAEDFGSAAPRVLFQGEEPPMSPAASRQPKPQAGRAAAPSENTEFEQDAAFNAPPQRDLTSAGQSVAPAALDFTASSAPGAAMPNSRSNRLPRVQQAAGSDQPSDLEIPEPVPFHQMPISEIPQQPAQLPPANRSAGNLPPMGLEPTPLNQSNPAPGFSEPTLDTPEPTPAPTMPLGRPQQQYNPPAASNAFERQADAFPQPEPAFSTTTNYQQAVPSTNNEPVPSVGAMRSAPATPQVTTPASPPPDEVYQVQSGDNYWTISRRYYGSARFFSALSEYNKHRIPSPEKMKPGMYVLVPDIEVLHQKYPQLTGGGPRDPAESAPAGFFVDSNGQPCYRIGKGDTLTDIAQNYLGRSSRWVQIQSMNQDRLGDGKTLKIGTILRLPSDASQVVLAPADSEIR
ncbi:LysM peptidoglycan-binding domain-containing protein [Planctomicrobium sp. SH661]|uniref:LysM peptidoglycan-binding domain-containing protein n=1 Tax=Planctomicrobium sp. SH661 TaxID=3448124 RepID=UPI003F5B5D12